MGKVAYPLLAAIVVLALLGACVPSAEEAESAAEPSGPPPPQEAPSVNVVHQLLTYVETESEDDTRRFDRGQTLPIGERVTRIGDPFTGVTPFGERELVRIRTSVGDEAFALGRYLVPNATLGVVVDDQAVIYSRPNLVSPTDDLLPRVSMVAIHDEENESEFLTITAYDHEAGTPYFDVYLKAEDVSPEAVDVQAGLLLFVARRTDAAVAKVELLENAEGLGESAFVDDVRRELAIARGEDPEDAMPADLVDLEIEEFSFAGVINENGTVVYRYPQQRPEYAETTLDEGAIVDVEERTVGAFTVDGGTSSWFRIANPPGWVFGAYIDPE